MAKIQLKKSTILDGANALEPTNTQMLFGELAVNYNADDPCIFFKDSDESIIRIAGKNAIGNRAIDIEGYPTLTDGLGAELDDRYLKLNSTGTQVIGTTGLTEFSGGIKVADSDTNLLELSEGGSSKVVVTNDGKMGVGTSTPTNVLQVVGTVAATTATISSNLTAAQIISTVADGTSPLSVTSTTRVNNFNSDTVDGLHAASFLRSDIDIVASNKITFSDEITVNSDVKLITDSKVIFGSNDLDMYASSDGSFYIDNKTDNNIKIREDGVNSIIIDTASRIVKPSVNNTGSIGTSTRKWNAGYLQNLDSTGTITANIINATTITGAINASNLTGTINTARLPATYTLADGITIEATGSLGYLTLNADKNIGLTTSGSNSFVRFRGNNGQGSYRFTKAGQTTIEGLLDFESLTSDRTFTYPDISGTIALTTSTIDNADKVDNLHASSFIRSDADDSKTGNLILDTASNTKHLYIGRTASTVNEYTKVGRDDAATIFYTKNDESSSRVVFQFENTDTEGANVGANSSNRTIKLISNQTNASITVEDNLVWHEGNDGAGSSLDADLLDGQHGSYYTGYTDTAVANLIDSSPGTLNTLNELASALGDDANFSTTITNSLATKLPLAGGAMTGNITFSGTQTVDGRDLSVDGSKLDGIETGATADQTASEILNLLKTVDTNGSGLNADKLDGQQGSYYQAASTAVNTSTTFGGDVVGTYNALAVVNDSHTHDTRYFTETEADARFLGITAKAADSDKLDNLTSGSFLRSNADHTYTGIITGNRLLLGGSQIVTSTAKLQVNGFMRTGNINLHEGGNSPNSNNKVLSNNSGVLQWDGDTVWTSSNNGAGSSLNADQVDGYEGADLLKSSENDSFSGNLTGSGTIYTTGTYMGIKGDGGGVCLTTNDGGGNANVTFNHKALVPDQAGSSGRIECAVDGGTAAMYFELKDNVTAGSTTGLTNILTLTTSNFTAFGNTVWHAGNHGATSTLDADLLDGQHGSYYTGYTDTAIANLIASSPSSLNTLNELAAALGDDANFSTTITDSIGLKLPKTGGTMSGNIVFTGSQTVDGRDLSVDGAKLDGIEAGATGDQTAAEILNLLKTVDTNTSGLNADTLDGIQASNFLKSNENDSFEGDTLTFSSNTIDPVILIRGTGPNFITFTSGGTSTVDSDSINLIYRSTPNTLGFERASDDTTLFSVDADNARATFSENIVVAGTVEVGDIPNDKYGSFQYATSDGYGFNWEFNQSVVIVNEQGTTHQALVLGDVSANSGKSGLFGISHTTDSGSTWTKKLDLQGDGELFIGTTGTSKVWHAGNDGDTSGLDADLLDGQEGSYYQNATNLTSGSIPGARITDIGDSQARIITFDNLEKSNLTADGQLGFDSSQGLLVYRIQQGTSGATTAVLDGWNVAAGTGISITNLGAGGTTTEEFTFSVTSAPKWTTARTVSLTGNVSGSASIDGSANASISTTVNTLGDINNETHTSDGQYDITLFGAKDGAAQSGAFSSKLVLKGGSSQTRSLELFQDRDGYATINTSYASNYLDFTGFNRLRLNQQLDLNGNNIIEVEDIGLRHRIFHDGDTNCYIEFHATDQWRVVTGNNERLEVNNTQTTINQNATIVGSTTITKDGDALNLRSTTNGEPVRVTFSSDVPDDQIGHIEYNHLDAESYGSSEAFILGGTEVTRTILADGKLMYKEGIYSKPGSGTGAGTRKDANWDTAHGWGDHSAAGYAQLSGATFTGDLRVDNDADLRIGDGSANERILIQKADNGVSDHIIFYNGTTRMGEIGCHDTTWLRLNQTTNKNIYTPRYIRADGGFFVDGTSKGINGSGNFTGGTIAGASDYSTLLRSNTDDTMTGALTITVNDKETGALRILANQTNPALNYYFAQEIESTLSGSNTFTGDHHQGGLWIDVDSTATGGGTSHEHRAYGIFVDLDVTGDADNAYAIYADSTVTPTTGTVTNVTGVYGRAEDNGGAGAVTNVTGVKGEAVSDNSNSDINNMYGGYFKSTNIADTGTINAAHGCYAEIEIPNNTGDHYGTMYVFRAEFDDNDDVAQTGTSYLYYGNYAGTNPTDAWGVHIADDVPNYFGGSIGIGTSAPAAKLDVNGNIHGTKLAVGTASNPKTNLDICLGADDDTGFSCPTDGNLKFWCNNSEVASWTSSTLTFAKTTTFNSRVNIRGHLDFTDGEFAYFGDDDDTSIVHNSNGWTYVNLKQNGMVLQDNGTDKIILEDSGIIRPSVSGTGSIGTSTKYWGASYFTSGTFSTSGNQLLLHNPDDETVIHRNDGGIYYILLSAAGADPSGSWSTMRPFFINLQTGMLGSENSQKFSGGTTIENSPLLVESDTGNSITLSTKVGNGNDSTFIIQKSRGGSGGPSQITAGDSLGQILWKGYDADSYNDAASITCVSTANTGDFNANLNISVGGNASTFSSSGLAVTGTINSTGEIKSSSNNIQVGEGSGSLAMTINDGQGNCNLTFNHAFGEPDQSGSSARIESPVDGTNARLIFELKDSVTGGTSTNLTNIMTMDLGAVTVTGSISATADITAYSSDRRLKENFRSIEEPIDKIKKLNGYIFDWNDKSEEVGFNPRRKKDEVGLIAQEVQDVIPQAVAPAPFDSELNHEGTEFISLSGENYLTVQYEKLVPLLIESIKEQQTQIDELRQEIKNLKGDK